MSEILFPNLSGNRVLGVVKTLPLFAPYAQIAFISNNSLRGLPMIDNILSQLAGQQSPNITSISLINRVNYRADKAATSTLDSWTVIGNHLRLPGNATAAVFHIGAFSIVSSYLDQLLHALVDYTRKLRLPVRDSAVIQAYFFKQLDEVIRDTFRFVSSMQCVKDALSVGSHVPLYHSDYMLPLSKVQSTIARSIVDSIDDLKLFQILQRVFSSHVHGYLSSLYGYNPSQGTSSGHFNAWRFQTTVVASLDTSTGRSKLKKRAAVEDDDESTNDGKEGDKAKSFSQGFLDRMQWKRLREIALDNTIIYLVIVTEKPILGYGAIPREFLSPPSELAKGEIVPWMPTTSDLDIFFQFWMEWLMQYQKGQVSSVRNLLLVSSGDVPYSSVIQDLHSGMKISQICMANSGYRQSHPPSLHQGSDADSFEVVMTGKIGAGFRYVHRFVNQEYFEMESVRGESSEFVIIEANHKAVMSDFRLLFPLNFLTLMKLFKAPDLELDSRQQTALPSGVAVLKMWFDTWKSLAIWSTISSAPQRPTLPSKNEENEVDGALLLVGPILGAPQATQLRTEDGKVKMHLFVPILIELDRKVVQKGEELTIFIWLNALVGFGGNSGGESFFQARNLSVF